MKMKKFLVMAFLLVASSQALANCDNCAIPFPDAGSCTAGCDSAWPGATCHYCYDGANMVNVYCCYPGGGGAPELPPGALPLLMIGTLYVLVRARKRLSFKR